MKFWDSSAIVPLILTEPRTKAMRRVLDDDPDIVAWWGSPIECASALARLHRDGHLDASDARDAQSLLNAIRGSWFEVQPADTVREHALRLLRLHPLRSGDALQLAAAIEWSGSPAHGTFVTLDDRLRDAAQREGFEVHIE